MGENISMEESPRFTYQGVDVYFISGQLNIIALRFLTEFIDRSSDNDIGVTMMLNKTRDVIRDYDYDR